MPLTEFQRASALRFVRDTAASLHSEVPRAIAGFRGVAAGLPEKPVLFALGHVSAVALGGRLAAMEAGLYDTFIGVSRYRPGSVHEALDYALGEYAREKGIRYHAISADALLAGKTDPVIPPEVLALLDREARKRPLVVDESIAFGSTSRLPENEPGSVVNLTKAGQLERLVVKPASRETFEKTVDNMGRNPGLWHSLLLATGRPVWRSFSYSWRGEGMASYEVLAAAKRTLEADAKRLGRLVVMQPATVSPALALIPGGLLAGVHSVYERDISGDHMSPAALTALAVLRGMDDTYRDIYVDRWDHDRHLVHIDRTESLSWSRITDRIARLNARVPAELSGRMSADESDALLHEVMGWPIGPNGWRNLLRPIAMLDALDTPPETPPTAPAAAG